MRIHNIHLSIIQVYRNIKFVIIASGIQAQIQLKSKICWESLLKGMRNTIQAKPFCRKNLEKLTTDKKEEDFKRKVQSQVLRRIPGYEFFEPYKHGWRICLSHQKNMTAKHILDEHLFGEPGNWLGKLERIQTNVLDIAKPYYSKVQKSIEKLAKRVRELIKNECEPYQGKKERTI